MADDVTQNIYRIKWIASRIAGKLAGPAIEGAEGEKFLWGPNARRRGEGEKGSEVKGRIWTENTIGTRLHEGGPYRRTEKHYRGNLIAKPYSQS